MALSAGSMAAQPAVGILDGWVPQIAKDLTTGAKRKLMQALLEDDILKAEASESIISLFGDGGLGHELATAVAGACGLIRIRGNIHTEDWIRAKTEMEAVSKSVAKKLDGRDLRLRTYHRARDWAMQLALRWKNSGLVTSR